MNPDCRLNIGVFDACVAADVPVFLWGPPGSGKSSAVRCWAGERGYALTELTPSVLDPTDLLGLPYQREDGRGGFDTWYAPPDWLSGILAAPDKKHRPVAGADRPRVARAHGRPVRPHRMEAPERERIGGGHLSRLAAPPSSSPVGQGLDADSGRLSGRPPHVQ